jgi:hypothetical protein
MKVEEQIKTYIAEAIEGSDLFVVELKVLPSPPNKTEYGDVNELA